MYIADWYDIRLSHLSPRDNWDKSDGRIYRLKAKDAKPIQPFDLSKLNSTQLVETLSHPNEWFREQAKRLLADRRDSSVVPILKDLVQSSQGQLALEALWSVYLSGGWDKAFALQQLKHPDEYVRAGRCDSLAIPSKWDPQSKPAWKNWHGRRPAWKFGANWPVPASDCLPAMPFR